MMKLSNRIEKVCTHQKDSKSKKELTSELININMHFKRYLSTL